MLELRIPLDFRFIRSALFLLAITIVDYLSIGCSLFNVDIAPGLSTRFFSSSIFIFTAIASQIFYPIFSSINTGITASIIFECCTITRKIATQVYCSLTRNGGELNMADFYFNTYICVFISTIVFAILSIIPYYYKGGNFLKNLPLIAVFSIMSSLGVELILELFKLPNITGFSATKNLIYKGVVGFCGLVLFFLDLYFPDFSFLIPVTSLIVILLFNIVFRVFNESSTIYLRNAHWISDCDMSQTNILNFFSLFKGASLNIHSIFSNIGNIVSMVFLNLIYINVNLLPYFYVTKKPINFNIEWRAQSVGNLITSLTGYPSYFVSSTSILFYKAGAHSKKTSLFGVIAPLTLFFIHPYLADYTPLALSTILVFYLGIVFIYSYFICKILIMSAQDIFIFIFGTLYCCLLGPQAGFAMVTAIYALISLYIQTDFLNKLTIKKNITANEENTNIDTNLSVSSNNHESNINNNTITTQDNETNITKKLQSTVNNTIQATVLIKNNNTNIIKQDNSSDLIIAKKTLIIDYPLTFMTIPRFTEDLASVSDEYYIDFSNCPYIDLNSNLLLYETVKDFTNITFLNPPMNFYHKLFAGIKNIKI